MSKKWLLIPILLIFIFAISITGLAQYKYTQQSGTGYFVSEADHADALENQNELRMILDELGLLLEHSKYGDASYPADENTTPGTLDVFTDYYTKLEIDALGYISDLSGFDTDDLVEGSVNKYFPGFTSLLADYSFTDNSTNWNTAYGWGDHALAGYLTSVALNDLSDVDTTGVADGKIIKYDIATSKWIIADDEDTGTTYTAGTGLDLTGTVFSLDASAFDLNDFPADPDADRYLFWNDTTGALTWAEGSGSGVTTFVGLTDTPLAYTGYAGYFPKVNAGETALEFAELTSADLSDVDSIAMLDENETVTGQWTFDGAFFIKKEGDETYNFPSFALSRYRDGTPTYIVQDDDILGVLSFGGAYNEDPLASASCQIRGVADGGWGTADLPSRLEFYTVSDGSPMASLRMAIDNAGNIKMGDGAWTNYVNITNAGVLSFEGSAALGSDMPCNSYGLTEVKRVEFDGKYDNGNSGATPTIDWANGQYQKITISANAVISFSNVFVGTITIDINYSGDYTVDFNAGYTVMTEGGTAISFTETTGAYDILKVYHNDDTNTYVIEVMEDVKEPV